MSLADGQREPLHTQVERYVLDGLPLLLFANWDYAEDWPADNLREVHRYALLTGRLISKQE